MADSDFSFSLPSLVSFLNSTETQQTQCYQVNIINDNVLEGVESFEMILQAPENVDRVDVDIGHIIVTINDDDHVTIGFKQTEYSVAEDGSEGGVNVCVLLEGAIDRDASVSIISQIGTAGCKLLDTTELLSCLSY